MTRLTYSVQLLPWHVKFVSLLRQTAILTATETKTLGKKLESTSTRILCYLLAFVRTDAGPNTL